MNKLPTISSVNMLYLITLVLVVIFGSFLQAWSPILGLILTELLLILAPAIIFLRLLHLPPDGTLRIYNPGRQLAIWSVIIGLGFALLALWLGNLITAWFGYQFALPPGFYPTNWSQAVFVYIGFCIAAPLCEETFFRGIIQRGYERHGPMAGILAGGLLFGLYHLSFERLVGLIPVAFVLGYVAWRGRSLFSSILVHFAYNSLSTVLIVIGSLRPDLTLDFFGSFPGAILGIFLGFVGLWMFRRAAPGIEPEVYEPLVESNSGIEASGQRSAPSIGSQIGVFWPLLVALFIFFTLAGLEFISGRFPEALAASNVKLSAPPWKQSSQWTYELQNILDEPVGDADCQLAPESRDFQFTCRLHQQAFKVQKGNSLFQTDAYDYQISATWQKDNLYLTKADALQEGSSLGFSFTLRQVAGGLLLSVKPPSNPTDTLSLPANALLEGEWPWRLSALDFNLGLSWKATLAWANRWSAQDQRSLPTAQNVIVTVQGSEPIATPAGNFIAWKVVVGDQTAWYDSNYPHTLLRYDNDFVSYLLKEAK
jgi:membrane protease YdiL (CAAX protease family)